MVVATGVDPRPLDIAGADHPKVIGYTEVLSGQVVAGAKVAVIGGGGIGHDTALFLAHGGGGEEGEVAGFRRHWGIGRDRVPAPPAPRAPAPPDRKRHTHVVAATHAGPAVAAPPSRARYSTEAGATGSASGGGSGSS